MVDRKSPYLENLTRDELFREIKERLGQAFGDRFEAVIVYGSEARGEAEPDSDIDLMVLIKGGIRWQDRRAATHAVFPLQTSYRERVLSTFVVDAEAFARQDRFLYLEAKQDGIWL